MMTREEAIAKCDRYNTETPIGRGAIVRRFRDEFLECLDELDAANHDLETIKRAIRESNMK